MNHSTIINKLRKRFPLINGIDAAVLYGSLARNEASVNSDVDIQLIVNKDFELAQFIMQIENEFIDEEVLAIRHIDLRSKVVLYFKSKPKIEFAICHSKEDIKRNYRGSAISSFDESILFERDQAITNLKVYLKDLLNNSVGIPEYLNVQGLINKFIYEFENCSNMHRRSDGYQFYFFYNIALHVAIQLHNLSKGLTRFNFLPKYYLANTLNGKEREEFYSINGSLFLPEANQKKRKLLDFFYASVEILVPGELSQLQEICEWFFERDYFWNFRDVSTLNKLIKPGILFRTATLSVFQQEPHFHALIQKKKIHAIVDLRADREIEELPYQSDSIKDINYVKCQFDPWNQPDWFKREHHYGTNEEIAYRYFAIACRVQIKNAFEVILHNETGSTAVHCFAGKDRTGIFISLIHLLSGATIETIHADYLASEVDVKLYRLEMVLEIIRNEGGIEAYLQNCGLHSDQISLLKQKLFV
jgi:predicted nucleotidyltransferase